MAADVLAVALELTPIAVLTFLAVVAIYVILTDPLAMFPVVRNR